VIASFGVLVQASTTMSAMRFSKPLYLALGWLCVGLGLLGIALPILPTTPFLIVAVWSFSRSSPELAAKIRNHPAAGPYIRDWQDYGVIPRKAKILATLMMTGTAAMLFLWSTAPVWLSAALSLGMGLVGAYIWSRPPVKPSR
jgi:uncharacterized membrane protein YbaN (DUF454 family)